MLRRYTFKLYPNASQDVALRGLASMLAQLWNAMLEMREAHYRRALQTGGKRTLSAFDQGKEITKLRAECPEWAALPSGHGERIAGDLDKAFKAFYSRAKAGAGAQSGYPLYKSSMRATAIAMREPKKSCWKLSKRQSETSWTFMLRGIGQMRARGKFPKDPESLKTADIKFHAGAWWLSVCCDIEAERDHGNVALNIDLDLIEEFAVVKTANGQSVPALSNPFFNGVVMGKLPKMNGLQESTCANPTNVGRAEESCQIASRTPSCANPTNVGRAEAPRSAAKSGATCADLANKESVEEAQAPCVTQEANIRRMEALVLSIQSAGDRRKKGSYRWRKSKQHVAKLKARIARMRKEALHKWSTEIVRNASDLTIVAPKIKENTRSGRGTAENHGAQVGTIAELNKRVLGFAPSSAIQMLEYKASAAGIRCDVVRKEDHEISVGQDLKAAAVATRRTRRIIKKVESAYV